jgi:hypothetical protein
MWERVGGRYYIFLLVHFIPRLNKQEENKHTTDPKRVYLSTQQ